VIWLWYTATWVVVGLVTLVIVRRSAPVHLEKRARRVDLQLPDEMRDHQLRNERAQSTVRAVALVAVFAGVLAAGVRWIDEPAVAALLILAWGLVLLLAAAAALAAVRERVRPAALSHSRRRLTAFLSPGRLAMLGGVGIWPTVVVTALVATGHAPRPRQALAALAITALAGGVLAALFAWARLPLRGVDLTALGWADIRRGQELYTLLAVPGMALLFASFALLPTVVDVATSGQLDGVVYMAVFVVTMVLGLSSIAAPKQRESRRWRSLFDQPVTVVDAVVPRREESAVEAAS
jgi:hypothetical protein